LGVRDTQLRLLGCQIIDYDEDTLPRETQQLYYHDLNALATEIALQLARSSIGTIMAIHLLDQERYLSREELNRAATL